MKEAEDNDEEDNDEERRHRRGGRATKLTLRNAGNDEDESDGAVLQTTNGYFFVLVALREPACFTAIPGFLPLLFSICRPPTPTRGERAPDVAGFGFPATGFQGPI